MGQIVQNNTIKKNANISMIIVNVNGSNALVKRLSECLDKQNT